MRTFIVTWRAFGFRAALRSTLRRFRYSRAARRALAEIARREIAKRAAPVARTEACEHCDGWGWYPYQPDNGDAYDALCWSCGGSGRQPIGRESEA